MSVPTEPATAHHRRSGTKPGFSPSRVSLCLAWMTATGYSREQLGGYYLIDAPDLDEAIDIAARIPGVRWGTIEIRPVMEIPGLPEDERPD